MNVPISARALLVLAASLVLGGCASRDHLSLEAQFERDKAALTQTDLDWVQDSCRGVAATAFQRGSEIVMIECSVGCSTRWIINEFYYEEPQLRLVVQRTWWLLDDEAYELEKPRLESETRFCFDDDRLARTQGDTPPVNTPAADLLLLSNELRALAMARK